MRIEHIAVFPISSPLPYPYGISTRIATARTATLVRIQTTDGYEGWGEAAGTPNETAQTLRTALIPDLLHVDLNEPQQAYEQIANEPQHKITAIGAIDTALWDIDAQINNQPLARHLNPLSASTVTPYAAGGYYRTNTSDRGAELSRDAQSIRMRGFTAFKVKIGRLSVKEDADALRKLRASIGPDIQLMADANEGYRHDLNAAQAMANVLNEIGATWFEEPLAIDRPDLYAELRQVSEVPIAGGEHLVGEDAFMKAIDNDAFDIVQPDVVWTGGVTGYRKIETIARQAQITCIPHVWGTPVSFFASLHLLCAYQDLNAKSQHVKLEYDQGPFPARDQLGERPSVDSNGQIPSVETPGLGFRPSASISQISGTGPENSV